MEMFTSQDPEEEILETEEEILEPETEILVYPEDQGQTIAMDPPVEQGEIYTEDISLFSDQSEDKELLQTTQEIRGLLKDYLGDETEEATEETTDYIKLLYQESKSQGEDIKQLRKEVRVSVQDQQTIGLLSVGSSVLLIGALVVFFFLGRIR